jgi:hypothetical protein
MPALEQDHHEGFVLAFRGADSSERGRPIRAAAPSLCNVDAGFQCGDDLSQHRYCSQSLGLRAFSLNLPWLRKRSFVPNLAAAVLRLLDWLDYAGTKLAP